MKLKKRENYKEGTGRGKKLVRRRRGIKLAGRVKGEMESKIFHLPALTLIKIKIKLKIKLVFIVNFVFSLH